MNSLQFFLKLNDLDLLTLTLRMNLNYIVKKLHNEVWIDSDLKKNWGFILSPFGIILPRIKTGLGIEWCYTYQVLILMAHFHYIQA